MKILYGSDMHFEFWQHSPQFAEIRLEEINDSDADHVVIAGDIDSNKERRDEWLNRIEKPLSFCLGNHDYYNAEWYDDKFENDLFVGGCLWTNFNENTVVEEYSRESITDFRLIKDWTIEKVKSIYYDHVDHIFNSNREFVVTHNPPTMNGVNPKFYGDILNYFFHNDLEMRIRSSNKKLWICGHSHWNFDYMIGDCRVVSNQFCYPKEDPKKKRWEILEIESK